MARLTRGSRARVDVGAGPDVTKGPGLKAMASPTGASQSAPLAANGAFRVCDRHVLRPSHAHPSADALLSPISRAIKKRKAQVPS